MKPPAHIREVLAVELPLSRQPSCHLCDHEAHVFSRCLMELDAGAMCPCPPHDPTGVYLKESP